MSDVRNLLASGFTVAQETYWQLLAKKFHYAGDPHKFRDPFELAIARDKWKLEREKNRRNNE